jgi:hypothetical protein
VKPKEKFAVRTVSPKIKIASSETIGPQGIRELLLIYYEYFTIRLNMKAKALFS